MNIDGLRSMRPDSDEAIANDLGFGNTTGVGSDGGYGGIYCFALQP